MKSISLSLIILGAALICNAASPLQVIHGPGPAPDPPAHPAPVPRVTGSTFDFRPAHLQHQGRPATGTVFDPSGAPAAGVVLAVIPIGGPDTWFKSDASGKFEVFLQGLPFGGPPPGYRGSWGAPIPEFYVFARDLEHNSVALVQIPDQAATNLDARLQEGLILSGSVQDRQGAPVPTASLWLALYTSPMRPMFNHPELKVNEHGAFSFRALVQGKQYCLDVGAPGYGFQRVMIEPNETQTNHLEWPAFQLEPADQTVSGQVVDLDGAPVAGATVRVAQMEQSSDTTVTDANGHFTLKVCAGRVGMIASVPAPGNDRNNQRFITANFHAESGDSNAVVRLGRR